MEQQPPPQPAVDPLLATNIGYNPQQRFDTDTVMSKHLDASELLNKLKNMLMG
ncbi:hypothetical protein LCGC14_2428380, partial [marine sediment metagenome]